MKSADTMFDRVFVMALHHGLGEQSFGIEEIQAKPRDPNWRLMNWQQLPDDRSFSIAVAGLRLMEPTIDWSNRHPDADGLRRIERIYVG